MGSVFRKEHKKYEFGNKVSIIRSKTGIILGELSFKNEYDRHTIEKVWDRSSNSPGSTSGSLHATENTEE